MNLGSIFSEKEYAQGYEFANSLGLTIKEIETKQEYQEIEIEYTNESGGIEIRKEKRLVEVRYFQIIEKPIYKPTNEEISNMRKQAYQERTDPLTLQKMRKQAIGEWTSEDEKEYVAQIKAISEQIASEFPYNSEEPTL